MRSRIYVTLGVFLGVSMAAALLEFPPLLLPVIVVGGAIVVWGTLQTYLPGRRRRKKFTVAPGFFLTLPTSSPGINAVLGLMSVGVLAALAVDDRRNDGELAGLLLAGAIVLAAFVGAQAFLAWQPLYVALTPTPGPLVAKLTLVVAHPEAVTIRGVGLFAGSAARPVITGQFDVHPRLMAAAIRWYVEHPEDRAAIGTEAEHARLLKATKGCTDLI